MPMGVLTGEKRRPLPSTGWIKLALFGLILILAALQGANCAEEPTESQCRPYIEKALKQQHIDVDDKSDELPPTSAEVSTEQEENPPTDELTSSTKESTLKTPDSHDSDEAEDDDQDTNENVTEEDKSDEKEDSVEAEADQDSSAKDKSEGDDDGSKEADDTKEDTDSKEDDDKTKEADDDDDDDDDDNDDNDDTKEESAEGDVEEKDADTKEDDNDDDDDTKEDDKDDDTKEDDKDDDDTKEDDNDTKEDDNDTKEDDKDDDDDTKEDDKDNDTKEEVKDDDTKEDEDDSKGDSKEAEADVDDGDESEDKDESQEKENETQEEESQEAASKEDADTGEDTEDTKENVTAEEKDVSGEGTEEEKDASAEGDTKEESGEDDDDKRKGVEESEEGTKEDEKEDSGEDTKEDDKDDSGEKDEGKSQEKTEEAASGEEQAESEASAEESTEATSVASAEESAETKEKGDSEASAEGDGDGSGEAADDGDEKNASEDSEEQESTPEEDLTKEVVIPDNLRSRDHITKILKLDEESVEAESVLSKAIESTLKTLKNLYDSAIKPLELLYKYRDLSNRHFGDPEIFSKPLILFMGPWSGGKSSTINYLLENEFSHMSLRTGAEPSPAYFNILMHGKDEEILDGTQLAADWTFSGLQKFGQGLLDRLRGVKLPNRLLEKVNIVEIPGILEIRKQVQRLFPFNDACQWFIDRADIIFLVYDPAKLDVGPETEAILDQLKGREYQTRIILNKADQVKPEELMRVQGTLIWNISPLMSSTEPPIMYSTSLWSMPYETGAPTRLLLAQERAFLRDLREAIDKRVENKIASARRFAVRVRNHAKMVDCYLTTYYNHKTFFGNRKKISDDIIESPQKYHIYEGLSTLTNISRYDLPDPDVYRDFFKINPLYDFTKLSDTCTYFRGCPINKLDVAIAYDLPELVGKYKKAVEAAKEQIQKTNS